MEKGAKIAALLSILAAAPAAAQTILVPCDLPIARLAPIHFKAHLRHPLHKHHRHKHPVGKRGRLGLHFALSRGLCPVFVGEALLPLPEDLGGPAGEEPFGGDYPIESWGADYGGEGSGWFGGFGGGGGGFGGDVPPWIFVVDTPPLVPIGPIVPPPWTPCVPPPVPTPVPEPATWLLILAGFAAIVLKGKRRWRPTRSPGC